MTIEEIIKRKEELGYSAERLSELSGVPLGTLQKILSGKTRVPRYETKQALERVLQKRTVNMIRESAVAYQTKPVKKQGEYTLEDYYAWPEDERIELIDGVIYDMSAPSFIHQRFAFHFAHLVQSYIEKKKGSCITMVSPVDVRLDRDYKTMLQPDALILCDRDKIRKWGIDGAPDFILEVLSDSTRKKDLSIKMKKYLCAGVREYWILDPREKMLYIYDFRDEGIPKVCTLSGEVGVGIYDGDLKISLDALADMFADIPEDVKDDIES